MKIKFANTNINRTLVMQKENSYNQCQSQILTIYYRTPGEPLGTASLYWHVTMQVIFLQPPVILFQDAGTLKTDARKASNPIISIEEITIKGDNVSVDFLVNECPDHGYIVDYDILKKQLPDIPLFDSKQLDATFAGYSEKLTDITLYLLQADHDVDNFIDFVKDQKEENAVDEPEQHQHNLTKPLNHKQNGKPKKTNAVK